MPEHLFPSLINTILIEPYYLPSYQPSTIGDIAMTRLRQRMIEGLQLRGLSGVTQDRYVRAVRQLADHYGKSLDNITEEDLRQYFLDLKNEKQASRSTCTIALFSAFANMVRPGDARLPILSGREPDLSIRGLPSVVRGQSTRCNQWAAYGRRRITTGKSPMG